jgi:hypothetical protein
MKKRIIFIGLCLVLLLVFTSLSYGAYDARYKLKEHPWGHLESPAFPYDPGQDQLLAVMIPGIVLWINYECAVNGSGGPHSIPAHGELNKQRTNRSAAPSSGMVVK